jgi:hypothetical protein
VPVRLNGAVSVWGIVKIYHRGTEPRSSSCSDTGMPSIIDDFSLYIPGWMPEFRCFCRFCRFCRFCCFCIVVRIVGLSLDEVQGVFIGGGKKFNSVGTVSRFERCFLYLGSLLLQVFERRIYEDLVCFGWRHDPVPCPKDGGCIYVADTPCQSYA